VRGAGWIAMKHKFLAFDIETAKILPEDFGDLMAHRPLGITCVATLAADEPDARRCFSEESCGKPAAQMSRADLSQFVDFLIDRTAAGYTIVTLNGLGFDFNILAEESGRLDDCRRLALDHVDMMFQIFCERGFGVGLNAAALALGLSKPEDVDGSVAPRLWSEGRHDVVLDYVACDCKLTLEIATTSEETGAFVWITKRGKRSRHDLPTGWLTAEQDLALPLPDTSWMDTPWPRTKFTNWL
jgi:hypothetical protein